MTKSLSGNAHAINRILVFAVALARNVRAVLEVIRVVPRADAPSLTRCVHQRALVELAPRLAAKHGHAGMLCDYPVCLVEEQLQAVLEGAIAHGDMNALAWLFTHLGPVPYVRPAWGSIQTWSAIGAAGHLHVLAWFTGRADQCRPLRNWRAEWQASAARHCHLAIIDWVVVPPLYGPVDWSVLAPIAAQNGHRPIIERWWQQQQQQSPPKADWIKIVRSLLRNSHLDLVDWMWGLVDPAWTRDSVVLDALLVHAFRSNDIRTMDWMWAACEHRTDANPSLSSDNVMDRVLRTIVLACGRGDLIDWVAAHAPHLFTGPRPHAWTRTHSIHNRTSIAYFAWWHDHCAEYGHLASASEQHIAATAAHFGRVDLLDAVWERRRHTTLSSGALLGQEMLDDAIRKGGLAVLKWLWAHPTVFDATKPMAVSRGTLIVAARHGYASVLAFLHRHWGWTDSELMCILRQSSQHCQLSILEWWRDEVLDISGTSVPSALDLHRLRSSFSSLPVIMFWNQVATEFVGLRISSVPVVYALAASSSLGHIAALQQRRGSRDGQALLLRAAWQSVSRSLRRTENDALYWWIQHLRRIGQPIAVSRDVYYHSSSRWRDMHKVVPDLCVHVGAPRSSHVLALRSF
ncbi:hypothetical protein BC828DRAFT_384094 [Blastocladiella britannica]|nr:hypothetical protein BC828DRAFT_384094 [Blastocladiella britannica]